MPTSKHKAHNLVHQAIERGELSRLDGSIKCTDCDNSATVYDHRDYDMPLDVQPVCRGCNARRGAEINKGEDIWTLVKIDAALQRRADLWVGKWNGSLVMRCSGAQTLSDSKKNKKRTNLRDGYQEEES